MEWGLITPHIVMKAGKITRNGVINGFPSSKELANAKFLLSDIKTMHFGIAKILVMRWHGIKLTRTPRHAMAWNKVNQNSPSPLRGFNCYELIFVFGEIKKPVGQDVLNYRVRSQPRADFHPCPKEINFWTKLQSLFVDSNDKVIDPFAGSGTGAVSSHILNCSYVGCEIDKDYYDAAVKRFNAETAQQSLFENTI